MHCVALPRRSDLGTLEVLTFAQSTCGSRDALGLFVYYRPCRSASVSTRSSAPREKRYEMNMKLAYSIVLGPGKAFAELANTPEQGPGERDPGSYCIA